MIQAIDTIYNGYKFRSRLEARWALFFDALNIPYQYEVQGYDINGIWYLPDFWMPEWNCWLEIKPTIPNLRDLDKEEYLKCSNLAKEKNGVVLLIGGDPWAKELEKVCNYFNFDYKVAIFSSKPITNKKNRKEENFIGLKIKLNESSKLSKSFYKDVLYPFLIEKKLISEKKQTIENLIKIDSDYYFQKYNKQNPNWLYGISENNFNFVMRSNKISLEENVSASYHQNIKLIQAYEKARQARFEKGC